MKSEAGFQELTLMCFDFFSGFSFKPCTNTGREGPSHYMCQSTLKTKDSTAEVEVIPSGPLKGVQVWTVPKNTTYRLEVH